MNRGVISKHQIKSDDFHSLAVPMLAEKRRSKCLQALRAAAALAVAAMHCFLNNGGLQPDAEPVFHEITHVLTSVAGGGVDLFFVLSGFLIYGIAAKPREHQLGSVARFVIRRAARIYPLYWATLCFFAALIVLRGFPLPDLGTFNWARILTLTTRDIPQQAPAWTLAYEVWFYIGMTAILLLPSRWFGRSLVIWAVIQFVALKFRPAHVPAFSLGYMFVAPQVLEFFMGCAVARAFESLPSPKTQSTSKALLVVAGGILMAGAAVCYQRIAQGQSLSQWQRVFYYGTPSALAVYALLRIERAGVITIPRWASYLGDCSYSIYLLHYPVMALLFVFPPVVYLSMTAIEKALTALAITVLLSFCTYELIERPGIAIGRWLSTKAPDTRFSTETN